VLVVVLVGALSLWPSFRQAQYVSRVEHAIVSAVSEYGVVQDVRGDGFGGHGGNGNYCEATVEVTGSVPAGSNPAFRRALGSRVREVEGLFVDRDGARVS
jgi:hypothetical protein